MSIVRGIANGIVFLNSIKFVCGSITPCFIGLYRFGVVKIFDMSGAIHTDKKNTLGHFCKLPHHFDFPGNPPETRSWVVFSGSTDVWALGALASNMIHNASTTSPFCAHHSRNTVCAFLKHKCCACNVYLSSTSSRSSLFSCRRFSSYRGCHRILLSGGCQQKV